jgi:hypothetical protein
VSDGKWGFVAMFASDSEVRERRVVVGGEADGGRLRVSLVVTMDKSIGVTSVNSREIGTGRKDSG